MKPTLIHAARNAAFLAFGLCAAGISHAQSYQFIDLGVGTASGINDLGQVVGQSNLGATLWNGTTATALVGGLGGTATGINDSGQIVGTTVNNGLSTAALWSSSGKLTNLNDPGNNLNFSASAINNAGQIVGTGAYGDVLLWNHSVNPTSLSSSAGVGYEGLGISNNGTVLGSVYNDASKSIIATTWQGSTATSLPGLVSYYGGAYAVAMNSSGVVVGSSATAPQSAASVAMEWKGNTVIQLGSLGGGVSYASDINNAGQIVGTSTGTNFYDYATIWKGTTAINLNSYLTPAEVQEGWMLTSATGINSKGWIVGDAYNNNTGAQDAFVLEVSPVPEADTWAMLGIGIALLASRKLIKSVLSRFAGGCKLPSHRAALA